MRVSSVGTNHLLCLSEEEVGLLVDLCHAGAFSEHIASSAERRERVDAFMWQVQQSLLPAVQKRYGKKVLKRTWAKGASDLLPGFLMSACTLVPLLLQHRVLHRGP